MMRYNIYHFTFDKKKTFVKFIILSFKDILMLSIAPLPPPQKKDEASNGGPPGPARPGPARPGPARPYLSLPARLLSTRPCVAPVLATCGGGGGRRGFIIILQTIYFSAGHY
jgi:hypothetical protein